MKILIKPEEPLERIRGEAGPKAAALANMHRHSIKIPKTAFIPQSLYHRFISSTGLVSRLAAELGRKRFEDMRWEELWDGSLRIRNMFLRVDCPREIEHALLEDIEETFGSMPLAIRSSALSEDAEGASFAGLHESFLNVRGPKEIMNRTVLVWASLWSDAALLYRQELGLDISESGMGIIVQGLVSGSRSGVAFGVSPVDPSQAVVESVWGLNKGLVDGDVEPDRWIIDRNTKAVLNHLSPERIKAVRPDNKSVKTVPLTRDEASSAPLTDLEVGTVYETVLKLENIFGGPQDVEWTFANEDLFILQSRPVTARSGMDKSGKKKNLNLRRSLDNLLRLGEKIDGELPQMTDTANNFAAADPASLSRQQLIEEISRRRDAVKKWREIYWRDFIPFAHGVRLFGQVYNDRIAPDDPFEFVGALQSQEMLSTERNSEMGELIDRIRAGKTRPNLESLRKDEAISALIDRFLRKHGAAMGVSPGSEHDRNNFLLLLSEMAADGSGGPSPVAGKKEDIAKRFIDSFPRNEREYAAVLLELGRKSYRYRDDDNIYLGRIEAELGRAVAEAENRLNGGPDGYERDPDPVLNAEEVIAGLRGTEVQVKKTDKFPVSLPKLTAGKRLVLRPRQLRGQPAGQGIAQGRVRLVQNRDDLFRFKRGEILVCDAVDPTMTFIVPLAAAVVERRGGMLIHGAIIAREYGLPCVTGVPDAARLINTGDLVTVDGYYGLVTVHTNTFGEDTTKTRG